MHKSISILIPLCVVIILLSGCSKKQNDKPTKNTDQDEPTKYADQSQLAKMSNQQGQTSAKQNKSVSNNSAFFSAAKKSLTNDTAKDIDGIIMPVLKKVFGDAKIIAESKSPETKVDGEVVENKITYVVRQILTSQDGTPLHSAFLAAGFSTSPRLGSKPTIWSGGAVMSLFETTRNRTYSLVINVDIKKQQIVVESYKLGSKYDRLM